ncbi:enoyl-CoA hydratase/isomerase family protein [Kibdelosporangium aridum]|uniref:enoyl-CoA hydratase/isomerase family protein n=1 Tax=Kibdelosporangium aridum TaxID=2030 RepID=UPI000525AEB4
MTARAPRVRLDHDGEGVAVVTFDSPPDNLYDEAMHDQLSSVIADFQAVPPRAVLFRAEGRMVSAGVDVNFFHTSPPRTLVQQLVAVTSAVESLPCPTVFAAHGLCLTWAFELALGCDLILASDRASFGLVERVIGLTPIMGGTQRLAERAGISRAKQMVLTGDLFSASTLERWNVVNQVLSSSSFDQQVRRIVSSMAAGPPRAHAATKQVLARYRVAGVAGADEDLPSIAAALFDTHDFQDAVRSFLRHGPGHAVFTGD